jgi:DNA ligase-1
MSRKFFGAKAAAPARQTTLAFATKAGSKDADKAEAEDEGDASTKENSDPEKGKMLRHSPALGQSSTIDS